MVDFFIWLLAVELLGILALPLVFAICCRLPDRGYTLTKPFALGLFSYMLWIFGLTHFVPNTRLVIMAIVAVSVVASALAWQKQWSEIRAFFRLERRMLLVAEGLFIVVFIFWLAILSEVPGINHTEQLMDFGFINAILQSRYFPPEDPWLAGHSINYYYFGHFMAAFLIKLTAVSPGIGYNLALASIPALVGVGSFGLLYNMVRCSGAGLKMAISFGLVASVLVIGIGNLEGVLEFAHLRGWGGEGFWEWVGIKGLVGGAATGSGAFPDDQIWWWRASRVIDTLTNGQSLDFTITEFPLFSYILGDLHAHVMSLPFLLLSLSLIFNLYLSREPLNVDWLRHRWLELMAIAFSIGMLAFINLWDFPVFLAIFGIMVMVKCYGDEGAILWKATSRAAIIGVPVVLLSVVLFLPFFIDLESQSFAIGRLGDDSTRPFLFFLTMGLFAILAVSFLIGQVAGLVRPSLKDVDIVVALTVIIIMPFLLWAAIGLLLSPFDGGMNAALSQIGSRLTWILPGLAIVGVAGFSFVQRVRMNRDYIVGYPLLLLMVACYLLVSVELFYVVDVFGNRMNTVFKVYYHSWLLLAIVGTYGLFYWRFHKPSNVFMNSLIRRIVRNIGNYTLAAVVIMLLMGSLYYSVGAVLERTDILDQNHSLDDNTLDGLAFLKRSEPGEYFAIEWLRDKAKWGRIVEAVGDDYSAYGRVSASTGMPTVLGWKGHEIQWRGPSASYGVREMDVATIYKSEDIDLVNNLLDRYDVRYVYVGERERFTYGDFQLLKFDKFMQIVFEQGGVIVYERIPVR
jgi:YYY domain-containing protein